MQKQNFKRPAVRLKRQCKRMKKILTHLIHRQRFARPVASMVMCCANMGCRHR